MSLSCSQPFNWGFVKHQNWCKHEDFNKGFPLKPQTFGLITLNEIQDCNNCIFISHELTKIAFYYIDSNWLCHLKWVKLPWSSSSHYKWMFYQRPTGNFDLKQVSNIDWVKKLTSILFPSHENLMFWLVYKQAPPLKGEREL